MNITPEDKTLLTKYTMGAKKIIYEPQRMKQFMQMLGTKEGAVQAVHVVTSVLNKHKPVPPQIMPILGVNVYIAMVDVAQEIMEQKPDPAIMKEVIGVILTEAQAPAAPTQAPPEGMLAQMQEEGEPPGDQATPDNMPAHEGAESPQIEQQEGAEEDPQADDPQMAAELAALRQRRGV